MPYYLFSPTQEEHHAPRAVVEFIPAADPNDMHIHEWVMGNWNDYIYCQNNHSTHFTLPKYQKKLEFHFGLFDWERIGMARLPHYARYGISLCIREEQSVNIRIARGVWNQLVSRKWNKEDPIGWRADGEGATYIVQGGLLTA